MTKTTLDLDPNEVIEADDETLPYAEEDWQDTEQTEFPKNLEPDLPFTLQLDKVTGEDIEINTTVTVTTL